MNYEKCSCDNCGQNIEYPANGRGEIVPCPTCGKAVALKTKPIQRTRIVKITTPFEQIGKSIDGLLERKERWIDGHWLLAWPLNYIFPSEPINVELCRQIAIIIESRGCCVETDVRSGSSTYNRYEAFALFEPFKGDSPVPSAKYLEAANLLRLCLQIAAADDWFDETKLDVIDRAINNHFTLSRTDRKRLIILEQLLAQRLCTSSYYTINKITKSVPADERLTTGKLLVEVAVAGDVITKEQRRVLERFFRIFEIPFNTLEEMINQTCPRLRFDTSKKSYWSLKRWREHRGEVFIDDFKLAQKKWNFTNWKLLNARWRALHEQLTKS